MSKIIHFFYFLLAQLIEIRSLFIRLDDRTIIFNSTNNQNYNFNTKYLFEYFIEKEPDYTVYFIINDDQKRKELIEKYGDFFISSHSVSGLLLASSAKTWVSSVLETPYLVASPLKNNRRIVYHIGHGVPLKKIGLAEEKITWLKYTNRYLRTRMFTHVLAYSQKFSAVLEEAFNNKRVKFVYFGQPRNDALAKSKDIAVNEIIKVYPKVVGAKEFILYAPTWRNYAETIFFPFSELDPTSLNEVLVKKSAFLFLREHPFYPSIIPPEVLKQSNILLFNSESFPEIMDYLSVFDRLITDYSSIYLDFIGLGKKIAFIPYDIDKYRKSTGFSIDYNKMTPGFKISAFHEFLSFIQLEDDGFSEDRKALAILTNTKIEGNSYENAQFIKELSIRS